MCPLTSTRAEAGGTLGKKGLSEPERSGRSKEYMGCRGPVFSDILHGCLSAAYMSGVWAWWICTKIWGFFYFPLPDLFADVTHCALPFSVAGCQVAVVLQVLEMTRETLNFSLLGYICPHSYIMVAGSFPFLKLSCTVFINVEIWVAGWSFFRDAT